MSIIRLLICHENLIFPQIIGDLIWIKLKRNQILMLLHQMRRYMKCILRLIDAWISTHFNGRE